MDERLLAALVGGGAALIGSLIPTVFGYLNAKRDREFEEKRALLEKQRELYNELMQILQKIINASSEQNFVDLQQAMLKTAIFCDDETSAAANDYYNALVASQQPDGLPMNKAEHQCHHRRILNGMRTNLGLKPLTSFEIVAFRPGREP